MNKYLQTSLVFLIILVIELAPFLYKDSYSFSEIDWIKPMAISLGIFVWISYKERKIKNK